MNPNTTSDYLEKLEIDRKIIVERLSSGNKHYLTADYHTHEELDTMFKEKNTEIKNNLEKSIKSAQIKFNKVNDLGKQEILTYLQQINSFITQEMELGPICYDLKDSRFTDEYIKKFKNFCKKYPKYASLKILKDSENKFKQFKKCSIKINDLKNKIQDKNDEKLGKKLISIKEEENRLSSELVRLHSKMMDIVEK